MIALPRDAFAPSTSISGNLVVFSRSEPRSTVCFANVSTLAWDAVAREADDADVGRTVVAAPFGDGAENVLNSSGELSRMANRLRECPKDVGISGIDAWRVSIQELEQRNHELIAKKSGSDMLNAELRRLASACPTLKFEALQRVSDVYAGRHYGRHVSTVSRSAPDVAQGLIRVGDVTDNEVRAPSLFFSGPTNIQVQERAQSAAPRLLMG